MKTALRRAIMLWLMTPSILCWGLIAYAWQQPSLSEENRRILERQDEKIANVTVQNQIQYMALREEMRLYHVNSELRLGAIEKLLYGLLASTGGLGTIVGLDKASYYRKRKRESDS